MQQNVTMSRSTFRNYLGQLRAYSYVDLLLLCLALHATPLQFVAASLLWFGFLIHLEWRHRDRGRAPWPAWAWVALWSAGLLLGFSLASGLFIVLSVAYSLKKRYPWVGQVSFLYNGLLKVCLVATMPGAGARVLLLVFVLTSLRNLAGDLRDIERDSAEDVQTLPVRLGLHNDIPWIYPAILAATSACWAAVGHLPIVFLMIAWLIQAVTYRLTPR